MKQRASGFISRRTFCVQTVTLLTAWQVFGIEAFAGDANDRPRTGRLPLDEHNRMQISPSDRCPVCGMQVAKYPKFASAIQLVDGRTYYFCSHGCLLRTWLHPEIFLKVQRRQIRHAVVREYFSGHQIDAEKVFWIAGSNIIGPMGPAIVAVKDDHSVKVFKKRHGGLSVFRLNELTDELWFALTGKPAKSE